MTKMIPSDKVEAVTRGLNEALGVSGWEEIRDLTERPGSNRAFRVVVRGAAYLLRINTRAGDVGRQFACMRAAAEAGLAPHVWYTNVEDRISITDFVVAQTLARLEALLRIPEALRMLHGLPAFPSAPFNTTCTFLLSPGPMLDGFLQRFRTVGLAAEEMLQRYEEIAAVYSRLEPELAPSHNDLFKPDNMLFDGQRLWLVDWEAAFQNDRYADVAVVANMIVTSEEEEVAFLERYFGAPADAYQRARFYLMRQLAHLFYAMAFVTEWAGDAPEYGEYQRRFWTGEVRLDGAAEKAVFGRVHADEFLRKVRQPRFAEALSTLQKKMS